MEQFQHGAVRGREFQPDLDGIDTGHGGGRSADLVLQFVLRHSAESEIQGRALARAIFFLPVILASGAISAAETSGLINLVGNATVAEELGQASGQFNVLSMVRILSEAGFPLP